MEYQERLDRHNLLVKVGWAGVIVSIILMVWLVVRYLDTLEKARATEKAALDKELWVLKKS